MDDKNLKTIKEELKKLSDTILILKKRINIVEHENKRLKSSVNIHDYNIKILSNAVKNKNTE
jgi:cell shape-determining protein MreC